MLKRLRIKFVCSIMIISTVLLAVIFGTVIRFTSDNLEKQSLSSLRVISEGAGINRGDFSGDSGEAGRDFELPSPPDNEGAPPDNGGKGGPMRPAASPYFTLVKDQDGSVSVSDSFFLEIGDEETINDLMEQALACEEESGVIDEYELRFLKTEKRDGGTRVVFADISAENSAVSSLTKNCLIIGGSVFAVLLIISIIFARIAVHPVEKAWDQQHQFVSDASHELKTPLTVITTNAEMLNMPDYSEEQKEQFSSNILSSATRMRGLVDGMLELAREDNGTSRMTFGRVDMTKLVTESALQFEPVFFEKELEFSYDIEDGVELVGSEPHIIETLEILLDNARKYCSPSGRVRVALKKQRQHCLLSVSSTGDEISKEDLKNIFKRFYRMDASRGEQPGYGLGLSIATEIVREHKGRIWAESEGGVNTFFVELPHGSESKK
ncbi:MAG: HAMP domain-containing histidine kinase [Clostridia bacterium]|nr:HAMP domain-containing histidine kinase [Clostridia bacterium]